MRAYQDKKNVQAKAYYNDRFYVAPQIPKDEVSTDEVFAKDVKDLESSFFVKEAYIQRGQLVVYISAKDNLAVMEFLRDKLNYNFLSELSAIDWLAKSGEFEIFYQMLSTSKKKRMRVKFFIKEKEEIKSKADHDALTKIYNRVKFDAVFPMVVDKALLHDEPFTLILFDIDHFKSVNDTHGHNVGDKVLVELARLVNMSLREKNDIFARWGGEEFVVLSRFTTNKEAELIANQLRKDIESYHFEVVQKVTCSFGVTQFQANDSKNDIFQRVDEALYEAKDNGRNQVIVK